MSSSQTLTVDVPPTPTIPALPEKTMESTDANIPSEETPSSSWTPAHAPSSNRYFIMKSLTKEDLAWSVANKVWATQPHNEITLNEAFKVYPSP